MTRPAEIPGYLGRVLDSSGGGVGTCQVAPGVLVTAWHVVDGLGVGEPGGKVLINQLGTDPSAGGAAPARVRAVDAVRDLAVLVCDRPLDEYVVGLVESDSVAAGTGVAVSGVAHVPGEDFRCTSATGSWEGPAMRADQVAMGQVKASGVARGMSGAPVRRAADGRVAGVVSGRYNAGDVWLQHSVWVARSEDLAVLVPGVAEVSLIGGLARGAALDVSLSVSSETVRLAGAGVDVRAGHGGVRPGLSHALHDVRRERASQRRLPARADAATGEVDVGSMSLRRSGQLLAESFLPGPVAQALAGVLRRAEQDNTPVRLGIDAPGLSVLPWEAMPEPAGGRPLALHPLVSVYRQGRAGEGGPLPGPLRIVVAIASPEVDGGPLLDYERELSSVLDAVRTARQDDAQVQVVPFATTGAIRAALGAGGVHVLHVSAHGAPGVLHLEDEQGHAREVTAEMLAEEAIPQGKMPPVIGLKACYTDVAGE
jgi:hypothetical protein